MKTMILDLENCLWVGGQRFLSSLYLIYDKAFYIINEMDEL